MDKSNFQYDETEKIYKTVYKGIEIEIDSLYMSDTSANLAEQVALLYPKKLLDIARHCLSNENFCRAYPDETVESIMTKLGTPDLTIYDDGGKLCYCEHELDDDHIIEIRFNGALQELCAISIDG